MEVKYLYYPNICSNVSHKVLTLIFACYKFKSIVAISQFRDITYRNIWNNSSVYLINYSWHSNMLLSKLCALMKPMEIFKSVM
jgi:hypothetical protein